MDERIDGRMNGWTIENMNGWMNGWMDGWTEKAMNECING